MPKKCSYCGKDVKESSFYVNPRSDKGRTCFEICPSCLQKINEQVKKVEVQNHFQKWLA
jgi:hypothetical protein